MGKFLPVFVLKIQLYVVKHKKKLTIICVCANYAVYLYYRNNN